MFFDDDTQLEGFSTVDLIDEVIRLRTSIRAHRDEKGHDRCWLDDVELYGILPEGTFGVDLALPPKDEFIKNCERYHAHRQDPSNPALTFIRQKDVPPVVMEMTREQVVKAKEEWLPVPTTPANGSKWKHYKGGIYSILYMARDCEDPNRFLVVYRSVEHGSVWVRELSNFNQPIADNFPRFEEINP